MKVIACLIDENVGGSRSMTATFFVRCQQTSSADYPLNKTICCFSFLFFLEAYGRARQGKEDSAFPLGNQQIASSTYLA